jgi:hypothetical protein
VQQKLIAEIHRSSIWPVFVTVDGNIRTPEKSDFIERDGSYIIFIPDGNIGSFKAAINVLIGTPLKYTRLWNSEAQFVVAGKNDFSISQQTFIHDHFLKFRIYKCIIVSQEHYIIDKACSRPININDVDTGMKLGVYTWFPYQSSDRCTEVNDITLLDSCVISAQGHFTKNTDLFPRKIINNLNGCPVKAVVRDGHWYFTTKYVHYKGSNGNDERYILGLEMDLLLVVLEQMNMTFEYVPSPEGFERLDLFGAMFTKKTDIALGGLGSHFLSVSYFDSTNS